MVVKAFQRLIVVKVLQTNLIDHMLIRAIQLQHSVKVLLKNLIKHMVVKAFQLLIVVEVLQITKRAKQTIEGYNMASLHL